MPRHGDEAGINPATSEVAGINAFFVCVCVCVCVCVFVCVCVCVCICVHRCTYAHAHAHRLRVSTPSACSAARRVLIAWYQLQFNVLSTNKTICFSGSEKGAQ